MYSSAQQIAQDHQTSPGIFTHRPRLFYIRVVNFTGSR
jgi:hypothetical protein